MKQFRSIFGTKRGWYWLCLCLSFATGANAEFQLVNVFTENMVLQRDMPVPVWGTADPGAMITAQFGGRQKSTKAGSDGKWRVELDPMKANTQPQVLTVSTPADSSITLTNILVGDVWLCSGQSNMAYQLQKDRLAESEIPQSGNPMIRMLLTEWQSSDTALDSVKRKEPWQEFSPEVAARCTAVGYWFAREIHATRGVPIGLITAYKGGSPVEAWMPKEALLASGGGEEIWQHYQEALKVFPEKHAVYLEEMDTWRARVKGLSLKERNKVKRPRLPYGPLDGNHPCGLFYGSIRPYIPMAIKGVLWYQGESNGCSPMRKAVNYESCFTNMIRAWRTDWGREDLPFLFVQLPPFRAMQPEPEDSVWSRVRDAQTRSLALPHTGMAVLTDAGQEDDIHPKDKKPAGDRLAQWAKAKVYGMDVIPNGPIYDKMEIVEEKIVITFKDCGQGLEARDLILIGGHKVSKDQLQGFAISGADEKFVWAKATITAPNQVTVSSREVRHPVAVRYAWASFPLCNLYNKDGLPAAPFRTDDFEPEILPGAR